MTQSMEGLRPRLEQLGKVAKEHKSLQFNNLLHHLNSGVTAQSIQSFESPCRQRRIDNIGWFEYQGKQCADSLSSLYQRIQSGRYKAKPVKRIWIPKGDGGEKANWHHGY